METKMCIKCGQEKPTDQFYLRKNLGIYRRECKACKYEQQKIWANNHKDNRAASTKRYRQTPHGRKRHAEYHKLKYQTDIFTRVSSNLRCRIRAMLKGRVKSTTTEKLSGCSYEFVISYLGSKFTPGMTWEKVLNGEIHIDHIRPCSSFNLDDPKQLAECCHYTNLQPLWAKDNLAKGMKYPWTMPVVPSNNPIPSP